LLKETRWRPDVLRRDVPGKRPPLIRAERLILTNSIQHLSRRNFKVTVEPPLDLVALASGG
jgi:hypothetical protein